MTSVVLWCHFRTVVLVIIIFDRHILRWREDKHNNHYISVCKIRSCVCWPTRFILFWYSSIKMKNNKCNRTIWFVRVSVLNANPAIPNLSLWRIWKRFYAEEISDIQCTFFHNATQHNNQHIVDVTYLSFDMIEWRSLEEKQIEQEFFEEDL